MNTDTAQTLPNNLGFKSNEKLPAEVLKDKMLFYHEIAENLLLKIITLLKEDAKPRADLLAIMYKKLSEANDVAIDCASKLAPYCHPKLESTEIRKEVTHRFVLRAPHVIPDTKEWLKTIDHKHEPDLKNLTKDVANSKRKGKLDG